MRRRQFMHGSVATALAASAPAAAQPAAAPREELVQARTEDDIVQSGLLVTPAGSGRRPAVLWIHGAAQNFYFPSYVGIARATAAAGYPLLSANTRMHDLACFLAYRGDSDVRGGAYWGLPSKEVLDIAAWISLLAARGYSSIVLVGHSAGATAVRNYLAERRDNRVMGLVQASGSIELPPRPTGPNVEAANAMVAKGQGQDLVPGLLPKVRISAGTYADFATIPDELWDFFGVKSSNPAIAKVRCPLLAWYGTGDDIAKAPELDRLRSLIARQPTGPVRVDTAMIEGANHEYVGYEDKVAKVLTDWIGTLRA